MHSADPALPLSLRINSAEAKLPWGDALGHAVELVDLAEDLQGAEAPLEQQVGYPSPTSLAHYTIQPSPCILTPVL